MPRSLSSDFRYWRLNCWLARWWHELRNDPPPFMVDHGRRWNGRWKTSQEVYFGRHVRCLRCGGKAKRP